MICSEKELGISDAHEGVIILDEDAPTGMPLVDYMGDAVINVDITPNMVRNAGVLGMARLRSFDRQNITPQVVSSRHQCLILHPGL